MNPAVKKGRSILLPTKDLLNTHIPQHTEIIEKVLQTHRKIRIG